VRRQGRARDPGNDPVSPHVRLPRALVDEARAEAERRDVSLSRIVRSALADWLDKHAGRDPLAPLSPTIDDAPPVPLEADPAWLDTVQGLPPGRSVR